MTYLSSTKYSTKQAINITNILTQLIEIIIKKTDLFNHIDLSKILICVAFNRRKSQGGNFAKLVPLKFKDGYDIIKYNERYYTMPKIMNNGTALLYLVYFYTPKFFDLTPINKLRVIFHELYHINPQFNGDIRRFTKTKTSHGSSIKKYNTLFENELITFYKYISKTDYIYFLEMDTKYFRENYKLIYCRRMKLPKPIPI